MSSKGTLEQVLTVWMQRAFQSAFPGGAPDPASVVVVPTGSPEFGDYQCNAALSLARVLKKPPRAIAEAVVGQPGVHESIDRMEVAGAGFINLYVKASWLAAYVEELVRDPALGVPRVGEGRTAVIDYSSPNVAKPMHIGHIRSTVIGNALDRMHRFLGYRVVSDNHIGDWGTQFGLLILGYRHFADPDAMEQRPIDELERLYVRSYEKSQADEAWLNQARQELVKLQAGDPENRALWDRFVGLSLTEFERVYRRLGVRFDLTRGESHYNERLPGIVQLLTDRGLARESEGALVVFLEEEKLPVCIVRKSDGAFNYATTDLATVESRVEEFAPDKIVYVTDERQQLHFRQIFAVCKRLGIAARLEHVWFGLMRLPEGTFSTRQGNVIKLERLIDEAESRALAVVKESSPEMPEERQKEVARAVGIGAVKYADLSQSPQTVVTFTWEKALALNGNSGPYLQYACARISSVQDKYRERFPNRDFADAPILLQEPVERTLAMKLAQFPEAVIRATESYRPSVLADYLYDLAGVYSTFYQNVPFLSAPDGIRESRVRLCSAVAKVLRTGLDLLGIETPERI